MVRGAVATVLGRAVDLTETVDTQGLAEVDVTGDGSSADVVPVFQLDFHPLSSLVTEILCVCKSYQSMSWGGSSLAAEVLTVSTHPGMGSFP